MESTGTAEEPEKFQSKSQLLFTPLMISMAGIACTALALVLYNFIVTKLWIRRNNSTTSSDGVILQQPIQENQVEKKMLESIPIFAFSILKLKREEERLFHVDEQSQCAVCLGELQEDEMVRLLPSCGHAFHVQCIDQWVVRSHHCNCPVCRSAIVAGSAMVAEEEEQDQEVLVMEVREEEDEEEILVMEVREEEEEGDQSGRARDSCDELRVVLPIIDDGLKSHVSVKIGRDQEEEDASVCSSSSSSSSSYSSSSSSCRSGSSDGSQRSCEESKEGSFGRLDCASTALMKSLSRLRSGHNRISNGMLPR